LTLGALMLWRDHRQVAIVAGALGSALAISGIVVPTRLGPLERGWMALAHAISKVTTPILMWLVYYVTVFPIGAIMRLIGRNPMARVKREGTLWVEHETHDADQMKHQF